MRPFSITPNEVVKSTSKFSNHNTYLAIFNQKKKDATFLEKDSRQTDTEIICRKYFSKKITNLLCFHKTSSCASAYHCKALKSLRLYGLTSLRAPIRSTKNLTLVYEKKDPSALVVPVNEMSKPNMLIPQVSGYKGLKSLEVHGGSQMISLRHAKALRSLQELSLTLNRDQIVENFNNIIRIRSLKKFSLDVVKSHSMQYPAQSGQIVQLCAKMIGLKQMKSVDLNLKHLCLERNPGSIELLLDGIEKANLPASHLQITLPSVYNIDTKKIQRALDSLDLLSLIHKTGMSICLNNSTSEENACDSLEQAKRKLDIHLSHYGIPMFIQRIQSQSDVQGFDLNKNINLLFKNNLDRSFPLLDNIHAKNLKSLTFTFEKIPDHNFTQTSADLVNIIKNSLYLQHISISKFKINPFVNGSYAEKSLQIFNEISRLENLESLEIEELSLAEVSLSLITKMLSTLNNLKKLHLSFSLKYNPEMVQSLFSFGNLRKLVELKVRLPNLDAKAQENFVKDLIRLEQMEILEIKGGSQLLKNVRARGILFGGLNVLKMLRRGMMDSDVKTGRDLNTGGLTVLGRRLSGHNNKEMAAEIRSRLNRMFANNKYLEIFSVIDASCYEITTTRP